MSSLVLLSFYFARCYSHPMPFLQLVSLTFGQASESPGKFVKTRPSRVYESAPLAEGQECTFLTSSQATPLPLSPGRHSAISLFVHSSHSGNAVTTLWHVISPATLLTSCQNPHGRQAKPPPSSSALGFFHSAGRRGGRRARGPWWLFLSASTPPEGSVGA